MTIGLLVVVDERDDLPRGGGYPRVTGPGQPGPRFDDIAVGHRARPLLPHLPDHRTDGIAGRGVVHYDNLEPRVFLRLELTQAVSQLFGPVARADDHADQWGLRQHLAATSQERPYRLVSRQPVAGKRAWCGHPGGQEPFGHRLPQFRPEQRAELGWGQPVLAKPNDATANGFA